MASLIDAFPAVARFCEECGSALAGAWHDDAGIQRVRRIFRALLSERDSFAGILEDVCSNGTLVDVGRPTMFENEIPVYVDPARSFSLRLYLYGPGRYTPVHDHNSWGLLGPLWGELDVTNYARRDDGAREGYAEIAETERMTLFRGEATATMPLDQGIHRVGNAQSGTVPSLNLYGRALLRGYVQGFDPEKRRVYRIMTPPSRKRMLAAEALDSLRLERA